MRKCTTEILIINISSNKKSHLELLVIGVGRYVYKKARIYQNLIVSGTMLNIFISVAIGAFSLN